MNTTLGLALTRGLADAGLLAWGGAMLFQLWLTPPGLAAQVQRVAWPGLGLAVVASLGWLALQAEVFGGPLPKVLSLTVFGHVWLLRLVLLAGSAFAAGFGGRWLAAPLAMAAVATQAWHGHAAAMARGFSWLLLSQGVHVLAAAAWLGGLLPLRAVIAAAPPPVAAAVCRRFSWLGTACVALLAATALFQSSVLIGGWGAWAGSDYGHVALLKAALFAVLLGFAIWHRFRLTPALEAGTTGLFDTVALEVAVGLATVLAAGLLASLPPAMGM